MNPINLGNSVSAVQWENENEIRSYPFESSDGVPDELFADLSIVSFRGGGYRLYSAHVGPGLVSVSLSNGSSALYCTVARSGFEAYRPYPLRSDGGSYGMCSFGQVDFSSPFTAKFGLSGPRVIDTLVFELRQGRLSRFVDDNSGRSASGDVEFRFSKGIEVSVSPYGGTLVASMSDELDDSVVSPCDSKDGRLRDGELSPIRSLNGVFPTKDGKIALVFA